MGMRVTSQTGLRASRISFKGLPDKVLGDTNRSDGVSSAGSSGSSANKNDEVPDSVFEGGVFHSRADIKLAKKIE